MVFTIVDERDQVWEIQRPTYRVEVWDNGLLQHGTGCVTWREFANEETVDGVLDWARSQPAKDDLVIVHVALPAGDLVHDPVSSHVGVVEIWRNAQVPRPIERA